MYTIPVPMSIGKGGACTPPWRPADSSHTDKRVPERKEKGGQSWKRTSRETRAWKHPSRKSMPLSTRDPLHGRRPGSGPHPDGNLLLDFRKIGLQKMVHDA